MNRQPELRNPKRPGTFTDAKRLMALDPLPPNSYDIMKALLEQTPDEFKDEFRGLFEAVVETLGTQAVP